MSLKDIITNSGLTRKDICDAVGVSSSYLANVESGSRKVGVTKVEQFAQVLGVSPSDIRPDLAALFVKDDTPENTKGAA